MFCPKCGKEIPSTAKVCGYCGTKLPVTAQKTVEPVAEEDERAPEKVAPTPTSPAQSKLETTTEHLSKRKFPLWAGALVSVLVVGAILIFILNPEIFRGPGVKSNTDIEPVSEAVGLLGTETDPNEEIGPGLDVELGSQQEVEVIQLNIACGDTFIAKVGAQLELHYGFWGIMGDEYYRENNDAIEFQFRLDGAPFYGERTKPIWTPELPCVDRSKYDDSLWDEGIWLSDTVYIDDLDIGTHEIEVIHYLDENITDGLDQDGDGELDRYGPGEILMRTYTLIVEP